MHRTRRFRHGDLELALHDLVSATGATAAPLLLLHELGGSSAAWNDVGTVGLWPGPVFALDFAGHGASGWRAGGAYTPELFAADADLALSEIGTPCCLAGAGLGAYVALLLAGARPDRVRAAFLLPGSGLDGGGAVPDSTRITISATDLDAWEKTRTASSFDPMVTACQGDLRPVDYAASFATAARRLLLAGDGGGPPWWEAVRDAPQAEAASAVLSRALSELARFA
jgi:pimeloyl-ACP methyl ester carboxylesterase